MKLFPNEMTRSAETLLETALLRVQTNAKIFGDQFPNYGDTTTYTLNQNNNWVAGFWPGMLWLAYHATGDVSLRDCAVNLLPSFEKRMACPI